ncbi:CysJI operon transcriptional activator [Thalassovita gelatinovora]|uniref:CysJI operon transcriptional activator n=1 Tax=Thalassovita gelatinovora TaxID=53501 RepID=A0A0P1F3L3_THAGE|nr:LysR substrate-binding domain-containing protein [Thalassovita gelatinovora]QIZ81791.1 LysR family transcriptional regulator [Thalassovita gelatinovora]CUH62317.1 CysJI operon transcriptional activator [Thalassovita gelatinovora]SER15498.1 DNA-binding transcriptional regulator, LysR family [Thalassovita gelatinovora]
MHIQLQDLQLFVQIAEAGNLTRGAQRAFLSAPAASARMRALEDQLGAQILYRSNKGISLTKAGETLLHHARLILRQVDFLKDDFAGDDFGGHVRIFANTTAVTEFLPELLADFMAERPQLTVDLQERLTHDILRGIQDGTADLGIFSGEVDAGELEVIRFSTDRLLLATPRGHTLTARPEVRLAETLDYEHIGLHEGSTLLAFLRGLMEKNGYERALRIQVRSFEAMCRLVEAGVGIGVVPESAARRHARTMQLELVRLSDDWALRDRCVALRSRSALPRSARALVEALIQSGVGGDTGT